MKVIDKIFQICLMLLILFLKSLNGQDGFLLALVRSLILKCLKIGKNLSITFVLLFFYE
jgi:hypothetical protein